MLKYFHKLWYMLYSNFNSIYCHLSLIFTLVFALALAIVFALWLCLFWFFFKHFHFLLHFLLHLYFFVALVALYSQLNFIYQLLLVDMQLTKYWHLDATISLLISQRKQKDSSFHFFLYAFFASRVAKFSLLASMDSTLLRVASETLFSMCYTNFQSIKPIEAYLCHKSTMPRVYSFVIFTIANKTLCVIPPQYSTYIWHIFLYCKVSSLGNFTC